MSDSQEIQRKQIPSSIAADVKSQKSSGKGRKRLQVKRIKSTELRAGIFYADCSCYRRNGLQDFCPRTLCGGIYNNHYKNQCKKILQQNEYDLVQNWSKRKLIPYLGSCLNNFAVKHHFQWFFCQASFNIVSLAVFFSFNSLYKIGNLCKTKPWPQCDLGIYFMRKLKRYHDKVDEIPPVTYTGTKQDWLAEVSQRRLKLQQAQALRTTK